MRKKLIPVAPLLLFAAVALGYAIWQALFGETPGDDAPYHLWRALFAGLIGVACLGLAASCLTA